MRYDGPCHVGKRGVSRLIPTFMNQLFTRCRPNPAISQEILSNVNCGGSFVLGAKSGSGKCTIIGEIQYARNNVACVSPQKRAS